MNQIQDIASFTIKELKLSKVEPKTEVEWTIVKGYLAEKVK